MLEDADPTDLPALARAERRAGDQAVQAARLERADLAWLMGGKRGRRIVWRWIDRAGVLKGSSFSHDALTMAFAEGVRNPAMRLLAMALELPDAFAAMLRENSAPQATNTEDHQDDD